MRRGECKRREVRGREAIRKSALALDRLRTVLDESAVDQLRAQTGYNPRKRKATAFRLLLSCIEACLYGKTLGFATIQAFFVRRFGVIRRRAFQLRFKSAEAAAFFRGALDRVVRHTVHEIAPQLGASIGPFADVVVYDGTGQRAPRRGRTRGLRGCTPDAAGSKWVIGYSLGRGMLLDATMGAAADSELTMWRQHCQPFAPNTLYLLDLGYFARDTFERADRCGADILMRLKADDKLRTKLRVVGGVEHGRRWKPRRTTTVASYLRRANRQRQRQLDLDVEWGLGRHALSLRVVGIRVKSHWYLYLTTIARDVMTPQVVASTYRLRWLIEFLFREWKQQADLGRSLTADRNALEALTCAALTTHVLVRSLRVAAAARLEVPLDALRPLACLHAFRAFAPDLVDALANDDADAWLDVVSAMTAAAYALAYEPRPSRSRPRIAHDLGALGG